MFLTRSSFLKTTDLCQMYSGLIPAFLYTKRQLFKYTYMPHCVMIKNKNDSKNLKFFLAPDESFRRSGVFKFTEANKQSYSFEPDTMENL